MRGAQRCAVEQTSASHAHSSAHKCFLSSPCVHVLCGAKVPFASVLSAIPALLVDCLALVQSFSGRGRRDVMFSTDSAYLSVLRALPEAVTEAALRFGFEKAWIAHRHCQGLQGRGKHFCRFAYACAFVLKGGVLIFELLQLFFRLSLHKFLLPLLSALETASLP